MVPGAGPLQHLPDSLIHHGGWEGGHARASIILVGAADLVVRVEGRRGEPHAVTVENAKDNESGATLGLALKVVDLAPDTKRRPRTILIATEAIATVNAEPTPGKRNDFGQV